jgi:hypothetical protein
MKRRTLLGMLAAAPLRARRPTAGMTVLAEELGTISPRLYGHFTEHIGRLIPTRSVPAIRLKIS